MTNEELQELSRKVAELYGVDVLRKTGELKPYFEDDGCYEVKIPIHDDWATLMDLAVDNGFFIWQYPTHGEISVGVDTESLAPHIADVSENYTNHTSLQQAIRVAIMMALIEVKKNANPNRTK